VIQVIYRKIVEVFHNLKKTIVKIKLKKFVSKKRIYSQTLWTKCSFKEVVQSNKKLLIKMSNQDKNSKNQNNKLTQLLTNKLMYFMIYKYQKKMISKDQLKYWIFHKD